MLGTNFGVDLMAGVVDSLTNSIDHNQEQDQHLVSRFSSIGVDTTDSNLLNGMKSFLTEISKVRAADQRRDENVQDEISDSDSEYSEYSDYNSFSS